MTFIFSTVTAKYNAFKLVSLLKSMCTAILQLIVCLTGKCHGVRFSNTLLRSLSSSSAASDNSDHQQVTNSSCSGNQ